MVTKRSERRRNAKPESMGRKLFTWCCYPLAGLGWILQKSARACKRVIFCYPRQVAILGTSIVVLGCGTVLLFSLNQKYDNLLPEKVIIHVDSVDLNAKIGRVTMRQVADARRLKWSRRRFMNSLAEQLKGIPSIDEAVLRSGYDRLLQIHAKEQFPLIQIQADNGKYIVSNKMKIMGRSEHIETEKYDMFLVKLPDVKLSKSGSLSVNLQWLYRNTRKISEWVKEAEISSKNPEFIWRQSSGFSLALDSGISVNLGENPQQKQFARLKSILVDLNSKGTKAAAVDLNFEDKAVIRLSESQNLNNTHL